MSPATKARQLEHKQKQLEDEKHAKANGLSATVIAAQQRSAYVPPHLRGNKTATNSVAATLARVEVKPKKIKSADDEPKQPKPPKVKKMSEEEKSKQIRSLQKKLRQIAELKQKTANGTQLNEEQQTKVATEDELNAELQKLQLES